MSTYLSTITSATGTLTTPSVFSAANTANATGAGTGAFSTPGGVSVSLDAWIGGTLTAGSIAAAGTTLSSLTVTGVTALFTTNISGVTRVTNGTASGSASTGALVVTAGGLGVFGDVWVGASLHAAGAAALTAGLTVTGALTSVTTLQTSGLATLASVSVTGAFSGGTSTPALTAAAETNCGAVTVQNQLLELNGTQNRLSMTFTCTPSAANTLTTFVVSALPNRSANTTNAYDIVAAIQGWAGTTAISNLFGLAVTSAKTYRVQFTPVDAATTHVLQVVFMYPSN